MLCVSLCFPCASHATAAVGEDGDGDFADFESTQARAALVKSKVGIAGHSGRVADKIEEMTYV